MEPQRPASSSLKKGSTEGDQVRRRLTFQEESGDARARAEGVGLLVRTAL